MLIPWRLSEREESTRDVEDIGDGETGAASEEDMVFDFVDAPNYSIRCYSNVRFASVEVKKL